MLGFFCMRCRLREFYQDRVHCSTGYLLDNITNTVEVDDIADNGDSPQVGHDQTADGVNLFVFVVDVEVLGQLVQQ